MPLSDTIEAAANALADTLTEHELEMLAEAFTDSAKRALPSAPGSTIVGRVGAALDERVRSGAGAE